MNTVPHQWNSWHHVAEGPQNCAEVLARPITIWRSVTQMPNFWASALLCPQQHPSYISYQLQWDTVKKKIKWNKNIQHLDWYIGNIPKCLFLFSLCQNKQFDLSLCLCCPAIGNCTMTTFSWKHCSGWGIQQPLVRRACHMHGPPILRAPGPTAYMQNIIGTLLEQPTNLHCLAVFWYVIWIKPKWFSTAEARGQNSAPTA